MLNLQVQQLIDSLTVFFIGSFFWIIFLCENFYRRSRSQQRKHNRDSKRSRSRSKSSHSRTRSQSHSISRSLSRRSRSHSKSRSRSGSRSRRLVYTEPSFLDAFRVLYLTRKYVFFLLCF